MCANLMIGVSRQLSIVPKGLMIVGRYRVLFALRKGKVHVLHIRGAYSF
jgi:hypothetical protein